MKAYNPQLVAAVEAAWTNRNVIAFLRVIRQGESRQTDEAFFLRWGGTDKPPIRFESLAQHPRLLEPGPNGPSSAAGAFQITMTTYDEFAPQLGIKDFSRDSQAKIAIAIIAHEGALDDVIAGRLREALAKCAGRWASFPDSLAGQKTRRYDELRRTFAEWGGVEVAELAVARPADTQPAAPIEERDLSGTPPVTGEKSIMDNVSEWFDSALAAAGKAAGAAAPVVGIANPAIGLALGLLGSLAEAFEPLAKEKLAKELGRHIDNPQIAAKMADNAIAKCKELTGLADPVQAVAAVKAAPAQVAAVQADVLDDLQRMAPMLEALGKEDDRVAQLDEASRNAAAARAKDDPDDQDPYLTRAVVRMMYGITAALGAGIVALYWQKGAIPGELLTIFAGLVGIIGTKFSTRIDHRYGSAHQSTATGVIQSRLK